MNTPETTDRNHLVIALDGPSGSGKSSVSKQVARALSASYLDTGAMYRAAAWWAQYTGLDLSSDEVDPEAVTRAVEQMPLVISTDPDHERVVVADSDITEEIRSPDISSLVSAVATNRDARALLVGRQRQLIDQSERIVAEGRDITTVVAPDAHARILLTASEQVRLARRGAQLNEAGSAVTPTELAAQVAGRDAKDSTVVDFMTPAEGVALVDSSALTFEETVQAVLEAIEAQTAPPRSDVAPTRTEIHHD
ncbi:(d)CMP kinase [Citricoccus sp. NR2]|uniref:(d)CMP kinase n=1 Tax=Citricoccus sp. NR2 TaxID=3004095 RepID=UPI0022DDE738|nr:(d)CMP kinase [Citricoccus sp. NR2]WBL18043.1 (d)CMP kinase [Citricoccus sp. NR2]